MRGWKQIVAGVVFGAAAPAWAEPDGDAFRGKAYATSMCASCHAVTADGSPSPVPPATPFAEVSLKQPDAEAFAAFINTVHPPTHGSTLKLSQAADIFAYIASLKATAEE